MNSVYLLQRQFRRKTGAEELQSPSWGPHAQVLRPLPGELLRPLCNMSGVCRRKTPGFACSHLVQSIQHTLEVSCNLSVFVACADWIGQKNPKIVLFFAAGTSGCGCRSSIRTFPKMPKLLLRCGTFMDRAGLSPSGEPLSPCLANMGERIQQTRKVFKQTSLRRPCFFLACSGKGCMTWKCGQEWREMGRTPPPRRDGQAAAWQRTRWADSPR